MASNLEILVVRKIGPIGIMLLIMAGQLLMITGVYVMLWYGVLLLLATMSTILLTPIKGRTVLGLMFFPNKPPTIARSLFRMVGDGWENLPKLPHELGMLLSWVLFFAGCILIIFGPSNYYPLTGLLPFSLLLVPELLTSSETRP
jgi:hypothetical protein